MSQSDYVDACIDLLYQLSSIDHAVNKTTPNYDAVVLGLKQVVSTSGSDITISNALSALTRYVTETCHPDGSKVHSTALLAILADATKKFPLWRTAFGLDQDDEHEKNNCILDVAREIVGQLLADQDDERSRSALRLIANCCADNNSNRKLFLSKDGLKTLVDCLENSLDSDLLIPTIYNVCNEYEDPGLENTQSSTTSEQAFEDQAHTNDISFAAKKLASACASRTDLTTFEMLLAPPIRPSTDRLGFLAALVELAALPATENMSSIFENRASTWNWSFVFRGVEIQTLEAAFDLANHNTECHVSILRAVLYILSQDEARQALLRRHDDSILQLIRLGVFPIGHDDREDFEEEIKACHKDFMEKFYTITGMPEFAGNKKANALLVESCLTALSGNTVLPPVMKSCILVILAQLSIQKQLRETLLGSENLLNTVSSTLNNDTTIETVYPAITLVTSLAFSPQASCALLTEPMLKGMQRLLNVGGLGLAVPYEAIHAFRWLCSDNLECLVLYTIDEGNGSIINSITGHFDRTIEAGTKSEVGWFFIELLKTVFPWFTKSELVGETLTRVRMTDAFDELIKVNGFKIAEVLSFVCTQAEPQDQRVHGWFGLGMLSVWGPGRLAIANAIEHYGLDQGVLDLLSKRDTPAYKNMVLMLSKMQSYTEEELSEKTIKFLNEANQTVNEHMASI